MHTQIRASTVCFPRAGWNVGADHPHVCSTETEGRQGSGTASRWERGLRGALGAGAGLLLPRGCARFSPVGPKLEVGADIRKLSNAGRVLATRGWLLQVVGQSSTRIHGLDILSMCATR